MENKRVTITVTVLRDKAQNIKILLVKKVFPLVRTNKVIQDKKEAFQKFLVCNDSSTSIKSSGHAAEE